MRAWVAPSYGPPEVLRLTDLPDPVPGPGEALVRVRAIGLNFADCAARLGVYPRVPRPPFVPGMEVSGEVVALGEGVSDPPVGTRVAAVPIFGGHAELVKLRARFLRPLPLNLDFVTGASLAVTGLTADHALFTVGRVRKDERVVITAAAGGVGTTAVQLAANAGARVLAVASTAAKRELAVHLGAHEATGYEDYPKALAGGVDVVMDAVGGALFRPGWKALRPNGRYVLYGFAAALGARRVRYLHAALGLLRMGIVFPSTLVQPSRTLAGFNLSLVPQLAEDFQARFGHLEDMLGEGTFKAVVGAVLPFEELPKAHALLQGRGSTGKVVVTL
ncbi:MAG TPA: zinc-binding dehydrogenase [Thermoanaerobaculaceae bacterium]|nr:zinc-binding dehydrogenase [Thermoanaerobaculaceae bacterium]